MKSGINLTVDLLTVRNIDARLPPRVYELRCMPYWCNYHGNIFWRTYRSAWHLHVLEDGRFIVVRVGVEHTLHWIFEPRIDIHYTKHRKGDEISRSLERPWILDLFMKMMKSWWH